MSLAPDQAASAPRAAAVIVNHNTRDHLVRCIDAVQRAGAEEVVVVDSGSSDGSVRAAGAVLGADSVIALANVGYGAAANAGVAATTAPTVVVCNADTVFDEGSVSELAAALEREPQLGAVGPRVRYPDGRPQASAREFPKTSVAVGHGLLGLWWPENPWTRQYRMLDRDPAEPRTVDWLSGCAIALRRSAFDDVGGFDPGYFMYVEDVDLGWRMAQAGWQLRYQPTAGVVHEVGASTGRRPARMVLAHARSLDRFHGRRHPGLGGRLIRPVLRLGLAAWAVVVIAWGFAVGRRSGRSSTGE